MVPVGPGAWLVWLLFPLLIAGALIFPFYAVWRYRYFRIHGEDERFRTIKRRFTLTTLILGGALYALLALAFVAPQVVPRFHRVAERGYLAFVVPIIFLDVLLAAVLSPRRTVSRPR